MWRNICSLKSSLRSGRSISAACCALRCCWRRGLSSVAARSISRCSPQAEDKAIKDALALQERVGLKLATDGEFRRRSYHSFFYRQLGDISIDTVGGEDAKGGTPGQRASQPVAMIKSRVRWTKPINVPRFQIHRTPTPSLSPRSRFPGLAHCISAAATPPCLAGAYKDLEHFWDDTVEAFGRELKALAEAGCRYVQIDETAFAKFGDPDVQATLKARGDDWSALIDKYIAVTNRVLQNCARRRCGSACIYAAAIAAANGTPRAATTRSPNGCSMPSTSRSTSSNTIRRAPASFTPLRLVPRHKNVVLGLVSTKTAVMESKDELKTRVEDATRFIDLDRLAVSPQCGFASVDTGNPISPELQERKLRLVVELARDIWGEA